MIVGGIDTQSELAKLNIHNIFSHQAVKNILQIFEHCANMSIAQKIFAQMAKALADIWQIEKNDRKNNGSWHYEFEKNCIQCLVRIVMKLPFPEALAVCKPLIEIAVDCPKEVSNFVEKLISAEDRSVGITPFWEIWQALANCIDKATWINQLDSQFGFGSDLLRILFLNLHTSSWKTEVSHWKRLEGQAHRIDDLFQKLPISIVLLQVYCQFLYEIGDRSLPQGFVFIAKRWVERDSVSLLSNANTVYCLESILIRRIDSDPYHLKSDPHVRAAVLKILDCMVEADSSAAYRMREDFVTPLSPDSKH